MTAVLLADRDSATGARSDTTATATTIRALAAVVVPPHLSVSGGARAAEQLSAALAPHCAITVASMMNGGGAGTASFATPAASRLHVRSWLPPLVPWSHLPNRYSTLFYRSDLPDLIASGNYDLVHIHNPMPALEMDRVARACIARGTPYVVSTHGFNEVANGVGIYGFDAIRRALWQRLVVAPVRHVVRNAATVFALSPADVPIVRSMGFRGEPILVCNGVPLPAPADPAIDHAALNRLGIPTERLPGQITCMFLANHTPNKGLPILLEAFAKLEIPYLLIVGGETRQSIDYDRSMTMCRPGQRIVVTGRLSDAEVGALFRRSDLFMFPTLADTFPLAVLEAMSHGLPVLASRIGGIPYQIDGNCGVLVPPGSADSLGAAVSALAAEPGRLAAMGRNAHARVAAEFTWERAAAQALAGYRQTIGGSRVAK
jgi:alpha-maltose-1-phosphate synthase